MEVVASPLNFSHSLSLSKRRRACSPMVENSAMTTDSGLCDEFMIDDNQAFSCKKRRLGSVDEIFTATVPSSPFPSSFQATPMEHVQKQFSGPSSPKRSQVEDTTNYENAHYMRELIYKQAQELENLKSDKTFLEAHNHELSSLNDKLMNENKILKKAVNIQQERQHHATTEIEAARKFKDEAENRIRMLEQIILSLRFHLQAQQHCSENDFMNFNNRPPDVF